MSRASTVIACPQCAWRAKHTADTAAEVIEFLGRLLNQHIIEKHAKEQK